MAMAATAQSFDSGLSGDVVQEALAEIHSQLAQLAGLLRDRGHRTHSISRAVAEISQVTRLAETPAMGPQVTRSAGTPTVACQVAPSAGTATVACQVAQSSETSTMDLQVARSSETSAVASEESVVWRTNWQPRLVGTTRQAVTGRESVQQTTEPQASGGSEVECAGVWPTFPEKSEPSQCTKPSLQSRARSVVRRPRTAPRPRPCAPALPVQSPAERREEQLRLASYPEHIARSVRLSRRFRPEAPFEELLATARAEAEAKTTKRSWWRRTA